MASLIEKPVKCPFNTGHLIATAGPSTKRLLTWRWTKDDEKTNTVGLQC